MIDSFSVRELVPCIGRSKDVGRNSACDHPGRDVVSHDGVGRQDGPGPNPAAAQDSDSGSDPDIGFEEHRIGHRPGLVPSFVGVDVMVLVTNGAVFGDEHAITDLDGIVRCDDRLPANEYAVPRINRPRGPTSSVQPSESRTPSPSTNSPYTIVGPPLRSEAPSRRGMSRARDDEQRPPQPHHRNPSAVPEALDDAFEGYCVPGHDYPSFECEAEQCPPLDRLPFVTRALALPEDDWGPTPALDLCCPPHKVRRLRREGRPSTLSPVTATAEAVAANCALFAILPGGPAPAPLRSISSWLFRGPGRCQSDHPAR